MASYESTLDTLEAELSAVLAVFRGLAPDDWQRSTLLVPVDSDLPKWTVFELAGHFDISIGLTRMLIAAPEQYAAGQGPDQLLHQPAVGDGAGRLLLCLRDGGREVPG